MPTSLAQFTADAQEARRSRTTKKGFSPVYIAGTDWYVAMGFVYDFGGQIATLVNGKWVGRLESPKAIAGLDRVQATSSTPPPARARRATRTRPHPYDVYAQGKRGLDRRSRRGSAAASATKSRRLDEAVRDAEPRQGPGDARLPRRLRPRGPDRARTTSRSRPTGSRIFTSTASREGACRRRATSRTRPTCSATASTSGRRSASWFVPTAKNWVNVENGNILRNDAGPDPDRQAEHQAGGVVRRATTSSSTLNQ